jgi:hypothetical protein
MDPTHNEADNKEETDIVCKKKRKKNADDAEHIIKTGDIHQSNGEHITEFTRLRKGYMN